MELRPGYKQTAVGAIPEGWEVKQLGQLSEFITSGSRGWAKHYSDRGSLFVRSQNIRDGHLDFTDRQCVIPPAGSEGSRTRLNCNDLLITITGNSVGNVAWVEQDLGEAYISQHVGLVRLLEPSLAEYVCHFLAPGSPGNKQIWASQSGQSKPGLNLKNLEDFRVALPSPPERSAIASALRDMDTLLGVLDQLIVKKHNLKQATMQALLTCKTRLPGFHGEWVALNMAEKSTLKARIGWQGLTTAEYLKDGEYYLVTGTDFENGQITWPSCCFVAYERYAQDKNIQLLPKDILLTKDGTIGKVGFIDNLPGPATLNSGVFVIRPKKNAYDPKFFYYILTSRIFNDFLTKLQAGSTISHLYQKDFVTFSFLAPPTVCEQTAIADVLTDMDGELTALEQRLAKTRDLKQGMTQELLTGRTRLVQ
jgi:type I restriction enzyme, S subunit